MECTQRLEYTQELYESRSERTCPEQIGFLGICGQKHPVKRGPNKIGRDPQTCSIVLNLNSISRQHAVINVLSQREFMLMDLDSANKTRLMDKVLPAYIPHPLKDGDMVQFGDIFGVFRLLEDDNDLPMTQAIDMPETPVSTRHMSKLTTVTTIPESPDVSDREESFIAPSQPKGQKCFQNSSSNHFIKPSSKVISIQPVGTNKIDNVYWNSLKKSVSLNSSLNDSTQSTRTIGRESNDASIFEMETQPPPSNANDSVDSIYTASTQVPDVPPSIHTSDTQIPAKSPNINTADTQIPNTSPTSIHTADTQAPHLSPPAIHTADTQIPTDSIHTLNTQLPEVCKVNGQQEMQFDLYASNKQNDIFEAETQCLMPVKTESIIMKKPPQKAPVENKMIDNITKNLNVSDEEILFDEMDCQDFAEDFASQPLLPSETLLESKLNISTEKPSKSPSIKKDVIVHSDSSTDCEDIDMLPTQKITKDKANEDEDLTDCEDLFNDEPKKRSSEPSKPQSKQVNLEDMLTQVIDDDPVENNVQNNSNFEDMLTQVIVPENVNKISSKNKSSNDENIEDVPTQIIVVSDEIIIAENKNLTNISFEDMPTQVIDDTENTPHKEKTNEKEFQDFVSPFKIPLISPIKLKRKDIKVITPKSKPLSSKSSPISLPDEDENYYAATQDILDDLCTQQPDDDDIVPSSVEDYEESKGLPHLDYLSPNKKTLTTNKSSGSSDSEEKVSKFVSNLSSQQIRDMVGVEPQVDNLKRSTSDPSDVELTPKKVRPIKFMDIDLPSSQEIKTSVSLYNKTEVTESSSESEVENDSEECTPILFRKKKKPKVDAKVDLTKVFEAETLPSRVITRVRKPTSRFQNSEVANKLTSNILKPKYLIEQEDDIDSDIITENITRLKSKSEKSKNKESNKEEKKTPEHAKNEKENETRTQKTNTKNKTKVITKSEPEQNPKQKRKNKEVCESEVPKITLNDTTKKTDSDIKTSEPFNLNITNESSCNSSKALEVDNHNTNTSVEISTKRSTRSTRNKRKVNVVIETPIEKDDSQNENPGRSNRRQNKKKPVEIDLTEEVTEVRRSVRQKPVREKKENVMEKTLEKPAEKKEKPATRRGRPPKHEQSTVYSVSSDSSADSPRNVKRAATGDLEPPSSKRTRSAVNANASILRSTPARLNKTHSVLFTAFPCEEVKSKLEKLGAVVVTEVKECTVVLTMQVKRTFKLLCAVGLGRPIVGPNWVQACVDTNMIVDPWLYTLKDEAAEKRFQFNLEKTLTGKRNFLKDFNVSATPSVMPSAPEMQLIVECSGGVWKEGGPNWVAVSCSADKAQWAALKRRGATVVSTEFILAGVLRQKADVVSNRIH